jgi:prepilin-type N-terminal cleavage/methylation domain-containing protein
MRLMMFSKKDVKGFTLIELLVVISIISLISAMILASINTARIKARDTKRIADMRQIINALNLFYDQYGCLPVTNGSTCISGYSEANSGTWDYSSQGGFLTFLQTSGIMREVPVDPINNMTGDTLPTGTFGYRYFCYPSGNNQGLHLGYFRERGTWGEVTVNNRTSISGWSDRDYVCK